MANIAYDDTIGASTMTYEEWSDYVDANGWGTSLGKGANENIKRNYWDKYIAPAGTITFPDGRVAKITEDTTEILPLKIVISMLLIHGLKVFMARMLLNTDLPVKTIK
jgi:hypothetical protein